MTLFGSLKSMVSGGSNFSNKNNINNNSNSINFGENNVSGYDYHRIPGYNPNDYFSTEGYGREGYVGPKSC